MNLTNDWECAAVAAMIGCFDWPLAAQIGAPGTQAEISIGVVGPGPLPISLGSIAIHPAAALTANGSNYVTITVAKRTAGGGAVTLGTLATNVTSWVAWTPINMVLASGAFVTPGDAITVAIAATGTGVTVPQLYLAGFPSII